MRGRDQDAVRVRFVTAVQRSCDAGRHPLRVCVLILTLALRLGPLLERHATQLARSLGADVAGIIIASYWLSVVCPCLHQSKQQPNEVASGLAAITTLGRTDKQTSPAEYE
jgi:hypothetical protein